jgi:hypothetical protein
LSACCGNQSFDGLISGPIGTQISASGGELETQFRLDRTFRNKDRVANFALRQVYQDYWDLAKEIMPPTGQKGALKYVLKGWDSWCMAKPNLLS